MTSRIQSPVPSGTVGNLTLYAVSDGHLDIPAAYFAELSPEEEVRVSPTTRFGANTWLIETPTRRILVDAGSGDWLKERFPESGQIDWTGDRETVTDIVVTHMHADHIGGLVRGNESLFAGAVIHLQEAEWRHWTDEALISAAPEDQRPMVALIQKLAAAFQAQVRLHRGETDLGDGITLVPAPGHTPGHQVVHVSSGQDEVMLLADAVVSDVLQFARPGIHYALDSDPAGAARTRQDLFDRLAADRIPCTATHLTTQGFGRLERHGSGFDFVTCPLPA